jgi:hypothetical protein
VVDELTKGEIYSRLELKEKYPQFSNLRVDPKGGKGRGIHKSKTDDTIWLFVSETKLGGEQKYNNLLDNDILHWQGEHNIQSDHLNKSVVDYKNVHVLYRENEKRYKNYGFRYEGEFTILEHTKNKPVKTKYGNTLYYDLVEAVFLRKASEPEYNNKFEEDGFDLNKANKEEKSIRAKAFNTKKRRIGQEKFRKTLLKEYDKMCVVTECDLEEAIEAAHIRDYSGEESNNVRNGILLRIDIHRLFDKGLITIDQDYTLILSEKLENSYYREYNGKKINLPNDKDVYPDKKAIKWHRRNKFVENDLLQKNE